jgi:hypothetical protein
MKPGAARARTKEEKVFAMGEIMPDKQPLVSMLRGWAPVVQFPRRLVAGGTGNFK